MAKVPSINCMPSIFTGINHCFQEILWQGMLFIYFPKKLDENSRHVYRPIKRFFEFSSSWPFYIKMGFGYCHLQVKILVQIRKQFLYSITVSNSTSLILWNCLDSSNWTIFSFFMTHHSIFKIKWRPREKLCFSTLLDSSGKKKIGEIVKPFTKQFSDNK